MTVVLAARRLSAGYHGVPAIEDLDLELSEGEMVLLAGPNGAGKTTTVMALAGGMRPLRGAVECDGAVTKMPLFRRVRSGLGLVSEHRSVFMNLTVLENLTLGRGSIARALEYIPEIEPRLKVKAGLLSGGEQQMLTLARVLASEPRIILADELSLGLAPIIVKRLHSALRVAADNGTAVLLVEQHVTLALNTVDRGYFMRRGRIELSGDAASLLASDAEIQRIYL